MNTPSVRPRWEDLPNDVRANVQARLGSPVVEVSYPEGGFTPGLALRLRCADRSEVFLKAADLALPMASHYRAEAVVGEHLPSVIAPELWWSVESHGWIVNAFEAVLGGEPELRPGPADLPGVLDVVGSLERELTPCPAPVGEAGETLSLLAGHWERLAAAPAGPDAWRTARRAWLTEMDDRDLLVKAAAGDTLVHCDLRADNMLVDAERVRVLGGSWSGVGGCGVLRPSADPCRSQPGQSGGRARSARTGVAGGRSESREHVRGGDHRLLSWHQVHGPGGGLGAYRGRAAQAGRRWIDYRLS